MYLYVFVTIPHFVNQSVPINLDFGVWCDGATALRHPVLACLVYLIWQPLNSKDTKERWIDAFRFFPLYLGMGSEIEAHVQDIMKWVSFLLLNVHAIATTHCHQPGSYRDTNPSAFVLAEACLLLCLSVSECRPRLHAEDDRQLDGECASTLSIL